MIVVALKPFLLICIIQTHLLMELDIFICDFHFVRLIWAIIDFFLIPKDVTEVYFKLL